MNTHDDKAGQAMNDNEMAPGHEDAPATPENGSTAPEAGDPSEAAPAVTTEQVERIGEVLGATRLPPPALAEWITEAEARAAFAAAPLSQDEVDAALPIATSAAHGSTEGVLATVATDGAPMGEPPTALKGDLSAPLHPTVEEARAAFEAALLEEEEARERAEVDLDAP